MSSIAAYFLSLLLLYKYWALFVFIFSASLILPIPTNTLLLAAGAFASQGYFSFLISLVVTVGASMFGDYVGYFLARRYGRQALQMLHIRRLPSYIEKLEHYVIKHPGPTIFITRFFGTADSLANIFSGFIGIPFLVFAFYDFVGNFISTGSVLYIGYFLGIHWQDFLNLFNLVGWIIIGIIVIFFLSIFIWYRHRNRPKTTGNNKQNI